MKNQTFGIEIETTGLGRERTARGPRARSSEQPPATSGAHLDDWKVPMPDGRQWTVESDGSVTDPSAEVVSPVCRWEDIEMVQEVVRALRRAGAKADASCGIHIHVGLGEHTPQSLRQAGEHRQRQGGPSDTGAGNLAGTTRALVPAGGAGVPHQQLNRRKPGTMEALAQLWYTRQRRVQRAGLAAARRFPLRHQPLPPPESARGLFHRAARAHHRIPRLQRHTPRGRNQSLHPALPRHLPIRRWLPNPPARRGPSPTTPSTPSGAGSCGWGSSARNSKPPGTHLTKRLPGNAAWRQAILTQFPNSPA